MMSRFKTIKFSRKNYSSKVVTKMVCIYDSEKVSEETAWKYCKKNTGSRNVFIVTYNRYCGVIKEMLEALDAGGNEDV